MGCISVIGDDYTLDEFCDLKWSREERVELGVLCAVGFDTLKKNKKIKKL